MLMTLESLIPVVIWVCKRPVHAGLQGRNKAEQSAGDVWILSWGGEAQEGTQR